MHTRLIKMYDIDNRMHMVAILINQGLFFRVVAWCPSFLIRKSGVFHNLARRQPISIKFFCTQLSMELQWNCAIVWVSVACWLCVMAKEVRSAHSFDDMAEEHDSFDVELGESSHDDQNFDAELTETDQADPLAGNDDSTVDDPVCCSVQLLLL